MATETLFFSRAKNDLVEERPSKYAVMFTISGAHREKISATFPYFSDGSVDEEALGEAASDGVKGFDILLKERCDIGIEPQEDYSGRSNIGTEEYEKKFVYWAPAEHKLTEAGYKVFLSQYIKWSEEQQKRILKKKDEKKDDKPKADQPQADQPKNDPPKNDQPKDDPPKKAPVTKIDKPVSKLTQDDISKFFDDDFDI